MKLLVVGGGGREHAIIRKLKENPAADTIYALPGNGGIARDAQCVPIAATDIDGIVRFAKEHEIDYAVVAPDDPLVLGCVDRLNAIGIPCFGPNASAAIIEGSKAFSKELMKKYGIPTAKYEIFTELDAALRYLDTDHPQLTVRDWTGPNPERLVLTHRAINDAPASSLSPSASSSPSTPSTPLNPSAPLAPSSASPFLCFPNIDAVIAHLTATQRQSLIVEGGPTVHQQFLDRGFWDELRVETAPFTIPGGISAPRIPDNAIADRIEQYDENIIRWYHR